MKLKQFGLLTAASLALVACSNESDPVMGGEDNAPKKVVLKLEGLSQGTKSTDANTSSDKAVTLNDVAIFLYASGGIIYEAAEYNSDSPEWASKEFEFTEVDPAVNRVLVIGNYANLKTNESAEFDDATSYVGDTDIDVLLAKTISLKSQNQVGTGTDKTTKANITLFGKTENNITDSNGDGTYEAAVSIKPIVSRLEVSKVSCKFVTPVGNGITQNATVEVEGIGLFDYYNTMNLGGTALTQLMDATKIAEPSTGTEGGQTYEFLATSGEWTWAYDLTTTGYNNTLTGNGSEQTLEMTKTAGGSATFAYNFFPVTSGSTIDGTSSAAKDQVLANIRLRVKVTNSGDSGKDYVVTTAFRDGTGSVVSPAPGKIYKLEYAFETTNIREDWGDDKIKVNVIVTTEPWEIIPVTPSF